MDILLQPFFPELGLENLGKTEDRVQRRTDLVTDIGEKIAFSLACRLRGIPFDP
ncbi:MAG: hypothetical protein ACD_75C02348G0001 [uncultured bacterium]|nr:MAG: hypothetical protein ACD_75C02348G0001 [uncultured bacterium]